jgi:hypothetical protein
VSAGVVGSSFHSQPYNSRTYMEGAMVNWVFMVSIVPANFKLVLDRAFLTEQDAHLCLRYNI